VIPAAYVTHWSAGAPWPTRTQVEQDLLLSRLICEIVNDPYLGAELVFRGGTCFHKLRIHPARRYSEDLDYVRSSGGGIKNLTAALTGLGDRLGFEVKTQLTANPKVYFRALSAEGGRMRIKIEVNTRERSPAEPVELVPYSVDSPWWSGNAEVRTFSSRELVATKIRALYQRKKGRDLFDLWLALTELSITGDEILQVFGPYRPDKLTAGLAEQNLRAKIADDEFRSDLDAYLTELPEAYNVEDAAELVIANVLRKL